jgi:hypothetical protein
MKLFGYSFSLNVLILIGILYLIMVVNALSSSCNREGLTPLQKAALGINQILGTMKDKMKQSGKNTITKAEYMQYRDSLMSIGQTSKNKNIMNQAMRAISQLPKPVG